LDHLADNEVSLINHITSGSFSMFNCSNNPTETAETCTPADTVEFHAAVIEGKQILKEIEKAERGQLRLGELADRLEPKYGDRTLAQFAKELDIAQCTLARYRDVYRAWANANICAPGRKSSPSYNTEPSPSYAALRELATHPEREEIIQQNPKITKREARDLMREHKKQSQGVEEAEQADDWTKHNRQWFKELVALASALYRKADVVVDECAPEQLENLRQVIDPNLLRDVRTSGRLVVRIADQLAELCGLDENYDRPTADAPSVQMAAE